MILDKKQVTFELKFQCPECNFESINKDQPGFYLSEEEESEGSSGMSFVCARCLANIEVKLVTLAHFPKKGLTPSTYNAG